jgi:hypothetical protein
MSLHPKDNKFQEVMTSSNIRIVVKYRLLVECAKDNLAITNMITSLQKILR